MRREKAGFTLAEVLIAVAILAILAAVAAPGVVAMRRNLKMTELNAYAKEIFLAGQNDLTARKAAGTVAVLSAGGSQNGDILTLEESSAATAKLLPDGAIDSVVAGGHYILKMNLSAAAMVEVFYSEKSFTTEERDAINAGTLSGSGSDAVQARREAMIGYYRGDAAATGGALYSSWPPKSPL